MHSFCIRFVTVAFPSEEEEKGPIIDLFCPILDPAWAGFAEKFNHKCGAMSTSSLQSFVNIDQAVL